MSKTLLDKKELESQSKNNQATVKISYLEIYIEKLKDQIDLSINDMKVFSNKKTDVVVKNLSSEM